MFTVHKMLFVFKKPLARRSAAFSVQLFDHFERDNPLAFIFPNSYVVVVDGYDVQVFSS